jgi:Raf kinase inhibitor-like YbhB/YbcL family protein
MKQIYIGSLFLICVVVAGVYMTKNQAARAPFTLTSSAFANNGEIPAQYTCDGANISPALSWQNIPSDTESFALIVEDPDAPSKTWVHWIVFNIPHSVTHLDEGASTQSYKTGTNDFNTQSYGGPCPPSGTHHYKFTLYALDTPLPIQSGVTKAQLVRAMQGHIVGEDILTGTYTNKLETISKAIKKIVK